MATPRQVGAWVLAATLAAGGLGTGFFLARRHAEPRGWGVFEMRDHVRRNSGVMPLFSALEGGPRQFQIADPGGLKDSRGNAITCTRASVKYARKSLTFDASNLSPWPEDITFSWPLYAGFSAVGNSDIAPDGTKSASVITFTTSGGGSYVGNGTPTAGGWVGTGGQYTASIYLKAGTATDAVVQIRDAASGYAVQGTATVSLTGGWQRFTVTTGATTSVSNHLIIFLTSATTTGTLSAWGAKVEQAALPPALTSPWIAAGNMAPTLTTGAGAAPDGSPYARVDFLATTGASDRSIVYTSSAVSAGQYTLSFYVKGVSGSGTLYANMQGGGGGDGTGTFNSTDWTLFSLTSTLTAGTNFTVLGSDRGVYPGEPASPAQSVYIYGARLDQDTSRGGAYVSPMLVQMPANTTSVEPEGLLVEGAATNLLQQSSALATSPWTAGGFGTNTATNAQAIAPDGTLTATRLQVAATSSAQYNEVYQPYTFSAGVYTFSVYLRSATGSPQTTYVFFQQVGAWVSCAVTNQWQRFSVTATLTAGAGYALIGTNNTTNPGTPTSSAVDVYAWGAQLETGTFPTSPIATAGSTATRAADVVTTPNPLTAPFPFYIGATLQPEGGAAWAAVGRLFVSVGAEGSPNSLRVFSNGGNIYTSDFDASGAQLGLVGGVSYADGSAHRVVAGKSAQTTYVQLSDGVAVGGMFASGTGLATQPALLYIGWGGDIANGWLSNIKVATTLSGAQ